MSDKQYTVAVIGSGGREHAIVKAIKKSPLIKEIYVLPGNGGIARDAYTVNVSATDKEGVCEFCKGHGVDYALVIPDDPLVLGMVDALNAVGIPCFGPDSKAAIIEGSKCFSKDFMKKYGIPTALYESFDKEEDAVAYIKKIDSYPMVIKADGLALGKGVIIAQSRDEAIGAVKAMMSDKKFGESGSKIVIEEFLTGPEVSVLSFTDGNVVVPMISSMDHKRAHDNDEGLNTGGMGTVAPNPYYTQTLADICMEKIFIPTIEGLKKEGRTFRGCLYFGLMLTPKGPKVIEYNCRFGDPETQVVLPLLESDLFEIMLATTNGTLADLDVRFSNKSACCVIYATKGYPEKYGKGYPITLPEYGPDCEIFVAGAKQDENGNLLSNGGRVLGITAVADTLRGAIEKAYDLTKKVSFDEGYYRNDIGARALEALK